MKTLKILNSNQLLRKSSDCKILAKYLGLNHWKVFVFHNVVNGNKYIKEMEVSDNSIYSPCYSKKIEVNLSNKEEMNNLFLDLQKNKGYKFLGNYVMDICGNYFLINL